MYHWLTSWFWVFACGFPARKLTVVGVTGTDGKTTTCHLIYEILKAAGHKVALVSTVGAYIGGKELDTGLHVTSPDARLLQPLLKQIADTGYTHVVLEVTSHGLDQNRLVGINFTVGLVTNITHEHLDYHQTMENYITAKSKLFRHAKYAVLNSDDPGSKNLKLKIFNLNSNFKIRIVNYAKTKLRVDNPALVGEYNQYNVGAAEAVAKIFGVEKYVPLVVRSFSAVPGRMEEIKLGQKFRAIVDFAHTPNALEQVLRELKRQKSKGKSLILVFGCAGLRDKLKRPMMGEIAARLADRVIITAEDPRTESLDQIYAQIVSGITPLNPPLNLRGGNPKGEGDIYRIDDRQKAINITVETAEAGDIVVVTGKGHEQSMCFGTTEYPWSDREAVEKAIRKYAL